MISFRLTAEEYERFRELCFNQGISSVSELARTAIHFFLQHPADLEEAGLESRVAKIEKRLELFAMDVKKLTSRNAIPTKDG